MLETRKEKDPKNVYNVQLVCKSVLSHIHRIWALV